jgi:hypothetical protein
MDTTIVKVRFSLKLNKYVLINYKSDLSFRNIKANK